MSKRMPAREEIVEPTKQLVSSPSRFFFSTDDVPKAARFEVFRDEIVTRHVKFDLANLDAEDFKGVIDARVAGDIVIARNYGSPAVWQRSKSALCDSDDGAILYLLKSGQARAEQGELDTPVRPGTGLIFHAGLPGRMSVFAGVDTWSIKIPGPVLRSAIKPGQAVRPLALTPANPLLALIWSYLDMFDRLPDNADPAMRAATGIHLADLVSLALGTNRNVLEQIHGRGLKAARIEAVLKAIRENFARPDISAAMVGRVLGITDRQVHRLLEETPKSFYEHVLECRLQEAHRQLCDPAALWLKVADIAFRAGFTDVTYFNRAFKTRFGETPTGVRSTSTRKTVTRHLRATALPTATRPV